MGIAYCYVSDIHLAEDAAQEAFAAACAKLATLTKQEKFLSWLGTICRRIAVRKGKRQQAQKRAESRARREAQGSNGADIASAVRDAVAALPESARAVVVLHYFGGLSHEQVADTLDTTPQAVHGRLQRGRRELSNHPELRDFQRNQNNDR